MTPLLPAMKRTKLRSWEAEKMREKDWIPAGVYPEQFEGREKERRWEVGKMRG